MSDDKHKPARVDLAAIPPLQKWAEVALRTLGKEGLLFSHHGEVMARPEAYERLSELFNEAEFAKIEANAIGFTERLHCMFCRQKLVPASYVILENTIVLRFCEPCAIEVAKQLLQVMGSENRLILMGKYHHACGKADPYCQCDNDE